MHWRPGSFAVSLAVDLPTERAVVDLPRCVHPAARRRQMTLRGWSGMAVSIALSRSDAPLQPVEIHEFGVRARGAAPAFLDKLPRGSG